MSYIKSLKNFGRILIDFWQFLRIRKKWWLAPIIIVMFVFGLLIVFTQGSALAPFIYTLF
jgi:type II secretory pathway component PulF